MSTPDRRFATPEEIQYAYLSFDHCMAELHGAIGTICVVIKREKLDDLRNAEHLRNTLRNCLDHPHALSQQLTTDFHALKWNLDFGLAELPTITYVHGTPQHSHWALENVMERLDEWIFDAGAIVEDACKKDDFVGFRDRLIASLPVRDEHINELWAFSQIERSRLIRDIATIRELFGKTSNSPSIVHDSQQPIWSDWMAKGDVVRALTQGVWRTLKRNSGKAGWPIIEEHPIHTKLARYQLPNKEVD